MKFNIEDYKGKYVMHCKTEEEAEDFCKYLDSIGRKWSSGHSYAELTEWNEYKEKKLATVLTMIHIRLYRVILLHTIIKS